MSNQFKIGLSNLHYAIITEETETGTIYATPKPLAPAITASISSEQEVTNAHADNRIIASAKGSLSAEIELETSEIPTEVVIELLGARKDANGVVSFNENDVPPYVALLFEAQLDSGAKAMFVFRKGAFSMGDESFSTKTDSIEFQNNTITGSFMADWSGDWKTMVRSDDDNVPESVIEEWYSSVYSTHGVETGESFQ